MPFMDGSRSSVPCQGETHSHSSDQVEGIAPAKDGSVILCGTTDGSFAAPNAGATDALAVKLDADGNELWSWQVSSRRPIIPGAWVL